MAARPAGMEHVDRLQLQTSLPSRIRYLHQFLNFSQDDVIALLEGQTYLRSAAPMITTKVYDKLLEFDVTGRIFTQRPRDTRIDKDPEVWAAPESDAINTRKMFLRWYFVRLTSDPTKPEYWEYLDLVGQMHSNQARQIPVFVEYIFLNVCLGYIQDIALEAIMLLPDLSDAKKVSLVRALTKVIWIQNDLFARYHVTEPEKPVETVHDASDRRHQHQKNQTANNQANEHMRHGRGSRTVNNEDNTSGESRLKRKNPSEARPTFLHD